MKERLKRGAGRAPGIDYGAGAVGKRLCGGGRMTSLTAAIEDTARTFMRR